MDWVGVSNESRDLRQGEVGVYDVRVCVAAKVRMIPIPKNDISGR